MENAGPPTIFANARRAARAQRAALRQTRDDPARFILDDIAEEITERLAFMRIEPARSLVIGDPARAFEPPGDVTRFMPGAINEESPLPAGPYDLIANIMSLDTVNDLPGALIHLRSALAPGGLAFCALPAAGSLPTLRSALLAADDDRPAARLHPLVDTRSGAALMQRAGFARQVADSFTLKASYRSFDRLVADLRDQGMGGVLASPPPPLSRTALERARSAFLEHADSNGRVVETFEVLILTGWKS